MEKDFPIRVWHEGNLGNITLMYLTALKLKMRMGFGKIYHVSIPIFGIDCPDFDTGGPQGGFHDTRDGCDRRNGALPMNAWKKIIPKSRASFFSLEGVYQNIRNYPSRSELNYDVTFPLLTNTPGGGEDELVINIRGGDILQGISELYPMIPVEFYKYIAQKTGKKVIFHGQLDESPYMDELKAAFPHATYLPSMGIKQDLDFLRRSKYIIPSISSFSWLAVWLSHAKKIYFPIAGLFNLGLHTGSMLLPFEDERYEFYSFPIYRATHINHYRSYIDPIRNAWEYIPRHAIAAIVAAREDHVDEYLQAFDVEDFLKMYPEMQPDYDQWGIQALVSSYINRLYFAGYKPLLVDEDFYSRSYPSAAREVAEYKYKSLMEHYILKGQFQGYQPKPTHS